MEEGTLFLRKISQLKFPIPSSIFRNMINKTYFKKSNGGFTLIELLVVISIIGLLSTVALTSLSGARKKARDSKRIAEIEQLQIALEIYYSSYGYYPQYTASVRCNTTAANSLAPLISEGLFSTILKDPLNTSTTLPRYCYEYMGLGTAANYSFVSSWYCEGRSRTDYLYSFQFSTETTRANYSLLTSSTGVANNEYKYCVHGPLK